MHLTKVWSQMVEIWGCRISTSKCKIFLDASAHERAERRLKQLQNKGLNVNFDDLLTEIQERDYEIVIGRCALASRIDLSAIDSTSLSIDEVVEKALQYIESVDSLAVK